MPEVRRRGKDPYARTAEPGHSGPWRMTVLKGVDSWQEPTAGQVASAKANGIQVWAGYFKIGNDGIYHGWADATFKLVQAGGLHTLAFCSTRANPVALKARAATLGIVIVADVES